VFFKDKVEAWSIVKELHFIHFFYPLFFDTLFQGLSDHLLRGLRWWCLENWCLGLILLNSTFTSKYWTSLGIESTINKRGMIVIDVISIWRHWKEYLRRVTLRTSWAQIQWWINWMIRIRIFKEWTWWYNRGNWIIPWFFNYRL